jgi:hypothetical protein
LSQQVLCPYRNAQKVLVRGSHHEGALKADACCGPNTGYLYHNISSPQRVRWKGSEEIFNENQVRLYRKLLAFGNEPFNLPLGLDQFKSIPAAVLP